MSLRAQISASQGRMLVSNPGFILRPDAAVAWDRATEKFGKKVLITGALRSYETQRRIFLERYARRAWPFRGPFGDVRSWSGKRYVRVRGAAAAVPGKSNHGSGDAVDVKTRREPRDPGHDFAVVFTSWTDRDRTRFLDVASEFGWRDTEGRRVNELWHLTYYPELDKHRGSTSGGSGSRTRRPQRLTTIRRGSSGYAVKLFQERYNEWKGRRVLKVDGDFGPSTLAAASDFQRSRGLTVDGVVGKNTWFEMAEGARANAPEYAVKIAQRIAGFEGAVVDGKHGPKTDAAMREVQRWLGVKDDGHWGPRTIATMKKKG